MTNYQTLPGAEEGACAGCGKRILWVQSEGQRIPLDPVAPTYALEIVNTTGGPPAQGQHVSSSMFERSARAGAPLFSSPERIEHRCPHRIGFGECPAFIDKADPRYDVDPDNRRAHNREHSSCTINYVTLLAKQTGQHEPDVGMVTIEWSCGTLRIYEATSGYSDGSSSWVEIAE